MSEIIIFISAFFVAFYLGIVLSGILQSLIDIIIGKILSFDLIHLRILWLDIQKNNGLLHVSLRKFQPVSECLMTKKYLSDKEDKLYFVWCHIVRCTVTAIFVLFIPWNEKWYLTNSTGDMIKEILILTILIMALHAFVWLIYSIYFMRTYKKRLSFYCKKVINDWRSGVSLQDQPMPPLETLLETMKADISERLRYQIIRFYQKLMIRDTEAMAQLVMWMEKYLISKPENLSVALTNEIPIYYSIIYYYSAICYDEEKATRYYRKVSEDLLLDMDSNGRRVLGSYQYYIMHDKEKAKITLHQGYENLKNFHSCNEEIETEKSMIMNLIQIVES